MTAKSATHYKREATRALLNAQDLIRKGWLRGRFRLTGFNWTTKKTERYYCALGAIRASSQQSGPVYYCALVALKEAVPASFRLTCLTAENGKFRGEKASIELLLTRYNDDRRQKRDDIELLFTQAVKLLKAEVNRAR